MRWKLSALLVRKEEERPVENGTNRINPGNQPAATETTVAAAAVVEQSNGNSVDLETRQKMEFIESLGLQPISVEDLELGNFDASGLFPEYLLEMIEADQELYPIYQSFFTENNDNDLFPQLNEVSVANDGSGASAHDGKRTAQQRPFDDSEPPVRVARMDNTNSPSTDGAHGSKFSHNGH